MDAPNCQVRQLPGLRSQAAPFDIGMQLGFQHMVAGHFVQFRPFLCRRLQSRRR